ncbi:4'-phosphopantetheinyl transferase superfamily [Hypoxylon sp. NC1633]|nr:4'-phosphopantetheinyl transferase superfamily [Hypoxylon sp. NC1633]
MMASKRIFSIGIGTDICKISRIYKVLNSPSCTRFLRRILTPQERKWPKPTKLVQYLATRPPPAPDDPQDPNIAQAAEYVAGRFAAKEAVIKAYSVRDLQFGDIEITYEGVVDPLDPPKRSAKRKLLAVIRDAQGREDAYARLSISHDGDYAVAMCLLDLPETESDAAPILGEGKPADDPK